MSTFFLRYITPANQVLITIMLAVDAWYGLWLAFTVQLVIFVVNGATLVSYHRDRREGTP